MMWDWLIPPDIPFEQGRLAPRARKPRSPQVVPERLQSEPSASGVQLDLLPVTTVDTAAPRLMKTAPVDATLANAMEALVIDAPQTMGVEPGSVRDIALLRSTSVQQFLHPLANRHTQLCGVDVAYLLQRARRKTIGFTVGPQGLAVRVPSWTTGSDIDQALLGKADWIVRKLHEVHERERVQQANRIEWDHGSQLLFAGHPLELRLLNPEEWHPEAALRGKSAANVVHRECLADGRQRLFIPLERGARKEQVRALVQAWMLREARSLFTERLQHFAPLMGVRWTRLRLNSARTRWGSASVDGSIRLNWRLMQHAPAVIDYVVVHELAHLRHMDHSPQFWQVVQMYLPDWKVHRKQLKDVPLPAWE